MLARLAFAVASLEWTLLVPAIMVADMHLAVEAIPDATFPPPFPADDPPTPAAAIAADPAAGPRNRPIWDNPIWAHPESRWLLVQFIVSLVLFHALHLSFPFLLPLLGMRLGFDDGDVALLVALPPAAGLLLFWLGSAFADENYVARGAVAGAGLAAGYWCAAAAASFFDLFVASFVFAVAACYSCNLVRARARARLVRARVLRACVRVRGCVLARRKPAGSGRWEKARGTGIRPAARPTGRPQ